MKVNLGDVSNILGNPNSAAGTLNQNNTIVEQAFEKTLSRDGTSPNQMEADLDLNHNDLLNVKTVATENLVLDGKIVTLEDAETLPEGVMLKVDYDPNGIQSDVFDRDNHTGQLPKSAGAVLLRPPVLKFVITADSQPITQAHVDNVERIFTSIKTLHGDLDALIFNGDLTDSGDNSRPPEYGSVNWGFREFLLSTASIVPYDRLFAIAGNHDINYNNMNDSQTYGQHAARMHEYLKFFDKLFYYTVWGNVCRIHMSAMARNTAGNITDYVMEWCKDIVANHQWCALIEVHIHQPWQNTVNGSSSVGGSQLQSERWFAWAGEPGYRVDTVFSGHSGSDSNNPLVESEVEINGVTYVGLDMNSGMTGDPEVPAYVSSYVVAEFVDGAEEVTYRRYNVDTGTVSKEWTIETAYPVQTAGAPRHDGRTQFDSRYDVFTTKKSIFVIPDRVTDDDGATWDYPTNVTALELGAEDRNDEMESGQGVSIDMFLPGANTGSSSQNQPNLNHAYGFGARIRWTRTSGGERSFGSMLQFYSAVSGDSAGDDYTEAQLKENLRMRPSEVTVYTTDDESSNAVVPASRLRIGGNIAMFRTSFSTSSSGAGFVFGGSGEAVSYRAGTNSQWHWRVFNNADGTPSATGGIASEGSRTKFQVTPSVWVSGGAGSPESSVSAPVGCLWLDTTNGVMYVKKSGTGNTGWKLVTQAA